MRLTRIARPRLKLLPAIDDLGAELWEIAENLHRLDLTKEQRDEHIRRYAELLERRAAEIPVVQNEPVEIGYGKPPARPKGLARQIAEETGLSKSTVQRALNPQPPMIKSVVEPESEADAIIREANAIVSLRWSFGMLSSANSSIRTDMDEKYCCAPQTASICHARWFSTNLRLKNMGNSIAEGHSVARQYATRRPVRTRNDFDIGERVGHRRHLWGQIFSDIRRAARSLPAC